MNMTITFTDGAVEVIDLPADINEYAEIWEPLDADLSTGVVGEWLRITDGRDLVHWYRTATIRSIAV